MNVSAIPIETVNKILSWGIHSRHRQLSLELHRSAHGEVQNGPFKGMTVTNEASWCGGDLGSKIIGCYEEELHDVIEKAIVRNPGIIINIGCAEGYYAVGLARRAPKAKIYAFDIDQAAQGVCRKNSAENGVLQQMFIGGECKDKDLINLCGDDANRLIVIDCEGYERHLISDDVIGKLLHCDLIIECHDFMDRSITPTLVNKFRNSHDIELIEEGARNPSQYPLLKSLSSYDRWLTICEFRPEVMSWLVCWSRQCG